MKLFDSIYIKRPRNRPAVIIAVLMLVHLVFFASPDVGYLFEQLWFGLRGLMRGNFSQILCALIDLANIAIWVLSVFVTWVVFQKSRKKGYLVLLVYFLLPLVVAPTARLIRHYTTQQQIKVYEQLQAAGQLPPRHRDHQSFSENSEAFAEDSAAFTEDQLPSANFAPPFVATRKFVFPVGPLLLLAGVWLLGKNEREGENA